MPAYQHRISSVQYQRVNFLKYTISDLYMFERLLFHFLVFFLQGNPGVQGPAGPEVIRVVQ